MNGIIDFFVNLNLPKEIITIIISALPIIEIRGSLPVAVSLLKMPIWQAYLWSVIGNSLIIIPVILFLEKFSDYLVSHKYFSKFFEWWFAKARKNKDLMQKYEAIGLAIFVAIPLPATGAWTGCVLAYLFGIKKRYAFIAIFAGVAFAGLIVMAITYGFVKFL
jgi:uncharacterized membrane protein